jgi:hypothetical protein
MRRFSWVSSWVWLSLSLVGCASGSSTNTSSGTPPATPQAGSTAASDVCAGDSWLPQLLGAKPTISNVMRLDAMKRSGKYGPAFANLQSPQMDYTYELSSIRSSIMEMYQWRPQPNVDDSKLTVVRQAFGDPRALKEGNTFLYGVPGPIGNGVLEYPPTQEAATQDISFRPRGGRALYTFPDGTWVRVDAWMMQRVRTAFASGPPPAVPAPPDVMWEICGSLDELAGTVREQSGVWGVRPERGALRFFAGRPVDGELVYRFQSPALAIRAEGEQRVRCSQPQTPRNDKGLFALVPPCGGLTSGTVDGPLLHYTFRMQ